MKTIIGWVMAAVVAYFSRLDFFVIYTAVSVAIEVYSSWITPANDKNA